MTEIIKNKKQSRSPWKHLVKQAKREATKARGQYRFENMPRAEKEEYIKHFGERPALPDPSKVSELEYYRAMFRRKRWAAQLEGQDPFLSQELVSKLNELELEAQKQQKEKKKTKVA